MSSEPLPLLHPVQNKEWTFFSILVLARIQPGSANVESIHLRYPILNHPRALLPLRARQSFAVQ
jgi:hypothetical protein